MKKTLLITAFLLTFALGALVFCLTPAQKADAATYGDLTYTVTDGEVTITDCTESVTSVTIPDTIDGYPVTSIGSSAFKGCSSLGRINIPEGVTSIGNDAFYYCKSLTIVDITDIVAWCNISFYDYDSNPMCLANNLYLNGTLVTDLILPEDGSITSIGNYAFYNCSMLTSISIPEGVTSIGGAAFQYCDSLTSINIPNSVTSIGDRAFYNCSMLTSISIPEGVTSIGAMAFYNCKSLTSISIPEGVVSIGDAAFLDCISLRSLNISDSVTNIGRYAFYHCIKLKSINIPVSVTSIGNYAFYNCTSLTSIYYNAVNASDLTSSNFVFSYVGLSGDGIKVTIGKDVKRIPTYLFCPYFSNPSNTPNITEVVFEEDGVCESIGSYAFYNCKKITSIYYNAANVADLTPSNFVFSYAGQSEDGIKVTIGKDVKRIPAYLFCPYMSNSSYAPNITEVVFEEGGVCESIGSYAFHNCKRITSIYYNAANVADLSSPNYVFSFAGRSEDGIKVTIGKDVKRIPAYLFCPLMSNSSNSPNITEVVFEEGGVCESIGSSAFAFCSGLTRVNIGSKVKNISVSAFSSCENLTSIEVDENNPIYQSNGNCVIKTANKSLVLGCGNSVIPTDGSVTSIGNYAFKGCSIKRITIPYSITSIGSYAFKDCTSLESVNILDSVTTIGSHAFEYCARLKSINIPNSIISIGDSAFYYCTMLDIVYYCGTAEEWSMIYIGSNNSWLSSSMRYYHKYEWVVTEPTCTEDGSKIKSCEFCSLIEASPISIPATGHIYSDWTMYTEPTPESAGFKSKVCESCSDEVFVMISYASGDIDSDGKLTNSDITLALRTMAGWNTEADMALVDSNYDGKITNRDIIALIRRIAYTE